MGRQGDNIYKRKDGRWEGRYVKNHSDKKIQYGYIYAKSYSEVKEKLDIIKNRDLVSEPSQAIFDFQPPTPTFEELSSEWLSAIKHKVKDSSYVKYRNLLNSYIIPAFSGKQVETILRQDISMLCITLSEKGGKRGTGLSPKTIKDTLSLIKNIYTFATTEKELEVADIKGLSVKLPHNSIRVLSRPEQQRLENCLRVNLNHCNIGILLCLYSGLRIGEICALTWQDISPSEQILHVTKTMQRLQQPEGNKKTKIIISTPKSECSIRKIPLPENIYTLLQGNRKKDDAYVLTGSKDHFIEPRTLENCFKRILLKSDIKDATFHSLRHTFATRCIELGFDMKSLSEILGHASVNITLNRYVHPSMELKQKNMNLLSDLYAVNNSSSYSPDH